MHVTPAPAHHESSPMRSAYQEIRSRILREEIPPSTRINIDALARELQVSSTPIREALRQLQGDNLVTQEPGRGYRTTPVLDAGELRDLFEFRLLIEPWAAKIAAQDRLQNPGYKLDRELREITALLAVQSDIRYELMDHDIRFHDLIFRSAENETLRATFSQAHCHLHAFRLHPGERTGEHTLAEHASIRAAIRDHQPELAEQAMREHLTLAFMRFEVAHGLGGKPPFLPGMHPDRPAASNSLSL